MRSRRVEEQQADTLAIWGARKDISLEKLPAIFGITSVGLRPPCATANIGNSKKQPADGPLIRRQSLCRQAEPPLLVLLASANSVER